MNVGASYGLTLPNLFIESIHLCNRRTLCAKSDHQVSNGTKAVWLKKYMNLVNTFEKRLEKISPKTYSLYRKIKDGTTLFFSELKTYAYVLRPIAKSKHDLSAFSRNELEVFRQMPSDARRMLPVLAVSLVPFMQYVAFPVAFMFPRHLLSRHFWSPEQRVEFAEINLGNRLHHYPVILNYIIKHVRDISDENFKNQFSQVIIKLNQHEELNLEEIVQLKPAFVERPFGLDYLAKTHLIYLWHLAKGLNLPTNKDSLIGHIRLLRAIDSAIIREGVTSLSIADLQQICFARGLVATGLSKEELISYIVQWTAVSNHVCDNSLSFLLHMPLFLAYNKSSNHRYVHKKTVRDTVKQIYTQH